jgi:hypothetical protein
MFSTVLFTIKVRFLLNIKNSIRTSQETHYVSATETNRLTLFREQIAVYFENNTKGEYKYIMRQQNLSN